MPGALIGKFFHVPVASFFSGVRIRLGTILGLGLGLGLLWCYGQGKFRVRVRIRVRVGFGL